MFRRHHRRRLIALLALFGLLFQQFAMATYVCPIERSDVQAASAEQAPCHHSGAPDRVRCHTHCHPQAASSDHAASPTVPAALLPPTTWLRVAAWLPEISRSELSRDVPARAPTPPISIQHCTFQI